MPDLSRSGSIQVSLSFRFTFYAPAPGTSAAPLVAVEAGPPLPWTISWGEDAVGLVGAVGDAELVGAAGDVCPAGDADVVGDAAVVGEIITELEEPDVGDVTPDGAVVASGTAAVVGSEPGP